MRWPIRTPSSPSGRPEVLGSVPADYVLSPLPVDIYAFACMAYEILTAELLFEAESELVIVQLHITHDGWPDRLAHFAQIPEYVDLAVVLAACLRQDPRQRPTASQAREAILRASLPLRDRTWPLTLERTETVLSA